jgi:hypothetical protein
MPCDPDLAAIAFRGLTVVLSDCAALSIVRRLEAGQGSPHRGRSVTLPLSPDGPKSILVSMVPSEYGMFLPTAKSIGPVSAPSDILDDKSQGPEPLLILDS